MNNAPPLPPPPSALYRSAHALASATTRKPTLPLARSRRLANASDDGVWGQQHLRLVHVLGEAAQKVLMIHGLYPRNSET